MKKIVMATALGLSPLSARAALPFASITQMFISDDKAAAESLSVLMAASDLEEVQRFFAMAEENEMQLEEVAIVSGEGLQTDYIYRESSLTSPEKNADLKVTVTYSCSVYEGTCDPSYKAEIVIN